MTGLAPVDRRQVAKAGQPGRMLPRESLAGRSGNRARTNRRRTANYESGGREFESLRARQKSNKRQHNLNARKDAMQNKIICTASAWQCAELDIRVR